MIGYYKYDIDDYIESLCGSAILIALCAIPLILIFRS